MRAAGWEPSLSCFFDEGGGRASRLARGFARRGADLLAAGKFDVVVVHRELFPHSLNRSIPLFAMRAPIVFDFDDAVFLPSQTGWRKHVAAPESTRRLVESSALVFAGNAYLAEYARKFSSRVEILPTVVDTDVYRPAVRPPREVPVIGWVGSPSTFRYLESLLPLLDKLARSFRFRLRIIGAGRPLKLENVEVESPPWRKEREEELFNDLDIGVYPLTDDPWARGKCGFKAIQYLACGVASVASPVGVVRDIVVDGVGGLWASSATQWTDALVHLLRTPEDRARLGVAGRLRACESYSLAAATPKVLAGLSGVARG